MTLGGSNTSLENNNVYGIEPKMYINDPSETLTGKREPQLRLV